MDRDKQNHLVVESNVLIHGKGTWSLAELRLYLAMVAKVHREDEDFRWYDIYVQEFMEDADIKGKYLHKRLKETAEQLVDKKLVLREDKVWAVYHFLAGAKYVEGQGYLQVCFHPDLKPFLLELKQNFTKYDLRHILPLPSVHSIRLYRLLKSDIYKNEIVYDVEELKQLFGLEQSYKNYFDFKKHIVLKAQQDLKDVTDISFEFIELKRGKGKKVTHLKFLVKSQKSKRALVEDNLLTHHDESNDANSSSTLQNEGTDDWVHIENQALYERLLSFGLSTKQAIHYITNFSEEYIIGNLDYVVKRAKNGEIQDRSAYTVKALSEDFRPKETVEEREKREKHQADKERREALEKAKREQEEQEDLYLKLLEQECHKLLQDPDFELDRVAEHFKKQTLDFFRTEIDRKQLKPSQYMRNLTIKGAFCRYLAEHYLDYYWHSFELWQDRKKGYG